MIIPYQTYFLPSHISYAGGILKYLEVIPPEESLFQGSCYVFDRRTSIDHGLQQGNLSVCYNCRHPLSPIDLEHGDYVLGVKCGFCSGEISQKQIDSSAQRQLQMTLAGQKKQKHLGYKPSSVLYTKRRSQLQNNQNGSK